MRVVTLNFWGTEAPLDERLAIAARELAAIDPDAIGLQEVRPYRDATTAHWLGERLGMHVVFAPATGDEGLAILSKEAPRSHQAITLPEARPNDTRILLSADLGEAWFHTTHLHYRLADGLAREAQVVAIDDAIRAIGGDAIHVLAGDFNCVPDSDEMRFLRGLHTLAGRRTHWQDAWLRVRPDDVGITWSSTNPYTERLRWLDIDRRIDYVLVSSRRRDGRGTVTRCALAITDPPASDHYAVVTEVRTR